MLQIKKDANDSDVEVTVGASFEVLLPENPTTGYRWQVVTSGAPILAIDDDAFDLPERSLPGRGGVRRWRLSAQQAGVAHLELAYARSWENQPAEVFKVTIRVV